MRLTGFVACVTWERIGNYCKFVVGKFARRRKDLENPVRKWEDTVRTDCKHTGCEDVDCVKLTHD
jgi:hypothetical protein